MSVKTTCHLAFQEAEQPNSASSGFTEIRVRGKTISAPSLVINDHNVVVTGKRLRIAALHDEELVEGGGVANPELFAETLRRKKIADIFTFAQKLTDTSPRYPYLVEWDNAAVVRTTNFKEWWEDRLPQESRKNVRRAKKRGVVTKELPFNDDLVKGIQGIYNEISMRQGQPFWHFGKPFDAVKLENATYLERSDFIGAYFEDELIGFIKIIYVECVGTLIQILSKNEHHDKRPMNALVAHAVRLCERRGMSFLVYGKYAYDGNRNSPLTEFKRRNGFEEIRFPRYFVPLNFKGGLALTCRLHRGAKGLLPKPARNLLLTLRSQYLPDRFHGYAVGRTGSLTV